MKNPVKGYVGLTNFAGIDFVLRVLKNEYPHQYPQLKPSVGAVLRDLRVLADLIRYL
jgi:hypothetical protein